MKLFLIKTSWFCLPVLLLLVINGFMADGNTDSFYLKFSSPKQSSLIIGTSKAAHGLRPDILNKELGKELRGSSLYNFSFTAYDSPYGEVYLEAIRKKLSEDTKDGIFIVTVDPWAISCSKEENVSTFRENNGCLGKTKYLNYSPAFPYLINSYRDPYLTVMQKRIKAAFSKTKNRNYLHNDGWLEDSISLDNESIAKRYEGTLSEYKRRLSRYGIAEIRKKYLIDVIDFLREHGDVYLVKMPVDPAFAKIDSTIYPEFDEFIITIAKQRGMPYFNFQNEYKNYLYVDGIHISIESATILSKRLAELIGQHISKTM